MKAAEYDEYLSAVHTLVNQEDVHSAEVSRARLIGQQDLDSAARAVRQVEDDQSARLHRLRALESQLASLTRRLAIDPEAAEESQAPPATLLAADQRITELQREISAIARHSDWVDRQPSVTVASAVSNPVSPSPRGAVQTTGEGSSTKTPTSVWRSPLVWALAILTVVVIVVVVVIIR